MFLTVSSLGGADRRRKIGGLTFSRGANRILLKSGVGIPEMILLKIVAFERTIRKF
jgi:hypothetical protein